MTSQYGRQVVQPTPAIDHRTVTNVEGVDSVPPAGNHADWIDAEKHGRCRIYVTTSFTGGGGDENVTISLWLRRRTSGGASYIIGRAPNPDDRWSSNGLTINDSDVVIFDTELDSDDFLVLVESIDIDGASAWSVDVKYSLR